MLNWWSFIKNAKRLKENDVIRFYNDTIDAKESKFSATVVKKDSEDGVLLRFNCQDEELSQYL